MPTLLTTDELTQYLHVSKETIFHLVDKGDLPSVRVGHKWFFNKEAIDQWLRPVMTERARLRVLIIDNDPHTGSLFKETLEGQGHTVITANASVQSMKYAKKLPFDQIFLGLKMPQIEDFELLNLIKSIKPQVPESIASDHSESPAIIEAPAPMHQGIAQQSLKGVL